MEEENKTDSSKKTLIYIFLAITTIVIVAGLSICLFDKKEEKKQDNPEKPYNPNNVVIDGFTYSTLKLETNEENLVYSPLSIKYALSMLQEGAANNTKDEIVKVIGENPPTKYNNIDKILSIANSVFIRDTYKEYVKETYIDTLKDKYNAEFFYDEFKDASKINNWIEDKTFKIIKNMLLDYQVQDPNLKMVLVNALAIDMEWASKFEGLNTNGRPFTKANGEEISVAMMHESTKSKQNKYYQDEDYTALSMPLKDYEDTQLEFIAIMPNSKNLKEILTNDDMESNINNIVDKLHTVDKEELSISIPRFEFEYKVNLTEDLKKIGIKEAFSSSADFSNMSSKELFVSDVLHKANIKLSERGIKAAAATVIMMKDNAMIPEEHEIKYLNFDKPFMFIIRDSKTKECWFVGTVYNPTLWENVKDDYKYR